MGRELQGEAVRVTHPLPLAFGTGRQGSLSEPPPSILRSAMNTSNLLERWRSQQRLPGGRRLFSLALARAVPQARWLRPNVLRLEAGLARVRISDRSGLHDHLGQVSGAALASLGEFTGLLAVSASLPGENVAFTRRLEIVRLAMASGPLVADCRVSDGEPIAGIEIRDETEAVVAQVSLTWDVRELHAGPLES